MNPLDNLEKAKDWAKNRANTYGNGCSFCVCKWNEGYIVHNSKFVKEHYKEFDFEEIFFCTDDYVLKQIIGLIKIHKIERDE